MARSTRSPLIVDATAPTAPAVCKNDRRLHFADLIKSLLARICIMASSTMEVYSNRLVGSTVLQSRCSARHAMLAKLLSSQSVSQREFETAVPRRVAQKAARQTPLLRGPVNVRDHEESARRSGGRNLGCWALPRSFSPLRGWRGKRSVSQARTKSAVNSSCIAALQDKEHGFLPAKIPPSNPPINQKCKTPLLPGTAILDRRRGQV